MTLDPSTHATKIANSVLTATGHDISRFIGIAMNSTHMEDDVILSVVSENISKCFKPSNEFDRIKFVEYGLFDPDLSFKFEKVFFYSSGEYNGRLALYADNTRSCIVNLDEIVKQFEDSVSYFMIGSNHVFFETKKDMMFARAIIMSHVFNETVSYT